MQTVEADASRVRATRFNSATVRVGLLGIGLDAYWQQFDGLEERLIGYLGVFEKKIAAPTRKICNFGLIDSVERGVQAAHQCRREDVDLLLIYVTTYALSSVLLPVLRKSAVPILLLNMQPTAAIDYARFNQGTDRVAMTGEWLAYCSSCPIPELANVMNRLGLRFRQVTGMLYDDPACWEEIEQWLRAIEAVHALEHSRLGLMGHYYTGMLDVGTDLVQVSGRLGPQIEMLEVDELTALRLRVDDDAARTMAERFQSFFDVGPDCDAQDLNHAARTAIALERLAEQHGLGMMAYFYIGAGVTENQSTVSSIILGTSLLTASGIPVAGEYEVKNVIAMKILDLLGAGGSFTEYYAMDFNANLVLMGHDGPGHPGIASDKLRVRPLKTYHGKVGRGLSIEMSVRHGPVTLLSIAEDREHGFKLLVAEAESVPGEILKIGNTNSFYRFAIGAKKFVESWNAEGPAHHCAIGVGHLGDQLAKVAWLLKLPIVRIC